MKKAITEAIALLQQAQKATSSDTAKKDVVKAINVLERALKTTTGDGGSDPNP